MSAFVPGVSARVRRLTLALTLAAVMPLPVAADSSWWSSAWTARRKLTFNNAAQAENLVGFPVMVRLDPSRIDYAKVQAAGQDLRFVDADNLTVLAHEIESWSPGGTSWVWVRVPQVDASSTSDFIYMYYGNPSAADGQNVAGAWDTDFKMVLHVDEGAGAHDDSTVNNNDGVTVNVASRGAAGGRVDGADFFDAGSAENVDVNDAASLNMAATDSFTLEAWIQTTMGGWGVVFSKEDVPTAGQYQLWVNGGVPDLWLVDDAGTGRQATSSVTANDGAWRYLVGRWNETTGQAQIFVDGVLRGTASGGLTSITPGTPLVIGEEGDGNRGGNFDGGIDEVRVSKTARSDAWIAAQHLSMTDAFITFGDEPTHRFTDVTARCGLSFGRSPLDKVSQRKIVRDEDGNRYLVFGRFRDTGGCAGYQEIKLARSTDDGATWTEVTLFGQGGIAWNTATNGFMYPAIDVNLARDELHVVVQHYSGQRLLYTKNVSLAAWDQAAAWTCAAGGRNSGGTCVYDGSEQVNATSAYGDTAPAIAVDGDGLPHVAFEGWQGSGSNRAVRWTFYRPGLGSWSPEDLVSNDACTSANRDVSIEASRGADQTGTVVSRVHFLYKQDADCVNTVDTLRYAYATRTGAETYSAVTRLPGTGSGFPPYTYLWISNGVGPARLAQGASLASQNGRLWAVGGFDSLSGTTVKMAYSTTNGDTWEVGAAGGLAVSGANFSEGYPAVGAASGFDHRIMSGLSAAGSSAQLGYQWLERARAFRYRTQLQGDATAGETGDYAHLTLEKRRPTRSSDFAYCWYVSKNNGAPPPNLLVDEIRCNVDPAVMYRALAPSTPNFTYAVGSVSATSGSRTLAGSGTAWRSANRGRGDRIDVDGTSYIVEDVLSDTSLRLTVPYRGTSGAGKPYTLSRQFSSLVNWENCIDGPTASSCTYFPVTSSSLVSDNRIEVGIAYDDSVSTHFAQGTAISGSTTDFVHGITLTVAPGNRHLGVANTGVEIVSVVPNPIIDIADRNVTVEWLALEAGTPGASGAVRVNVDDPALNGPVVVRHNVINGVGGSGIVVGTTASQNVILDVHDNVVKPTSFATYYGLHLNPSGSTWNPGSDVYVSHNTFFPGTTNTIGINAAPASNGAVTLVNNIAHSWTTECIQVPSPSAASDYNLVGPKDGDLDGSCTTAPGVNSEVNVPLTGAGGVNFVNPGSDDLHLQAASVAIDQGTTLAATHLIDIDGGRRPNGAAWDIGADEFGSTTAVTLSSFLAVPGDSSVTLEWRTGSEIHNVGFHVWRGLSASGPWTRATPAIIPGAGTSVLGHAYSWLDRGLANGVAYFYRLEDVDTSSVSTFHGPVSAVPGSAGAPPPPESGGGSGGGSSPGGGSTASTCPSWLVAAYGATLPAGASCTRHGDPDAVSFDVVFRDARGATLELKTRGFWALRLPAGPGEASGTVRVYVPGLDTPSEPTAPALPLRRALVDATVGRKVRLVSAEPFDLFGFPGMRPAAVGRPEAAVSADGTVRPARRAVLAPRLSRGYLPQFAARLAPSVFQGETKSAVVEIFPVRFDGYRQQLVLARRVRVRLAFSGTDASETGSGATGRVPPKRVPFRETLAQLHTTRRGLHAVAFEDLFPARRLGMAVSVLRLQRQGVSVPFRVEPVSSTFGPGSVLYFFADRVASSTDFSPEVAWELVRGTGTSIGVVLANPGDGPSTNSIALASFEANKFYMPDLLEAADPWLWQAAIASPGAPVATTPLTFALSGIDPASPAGARLVVHLQGGSESGYTTDHHLEVRLNGSPVGEASFSGKKPYHFDAALPVASLLEGANTLSLVNLADTGVSSRVFLDRFSLSHPQVPSLRDGAFEGTFAGPGVAQVATTGASPMVLDTTLAGMADPSSPGTTAAPRDDRADVSDSSPVQWLLGAESTGSAVRFRVEAGHRYCVVSPEGLLSPRVSRPAPSALRDTRNQADFILVAPRDFMDAAQPLLDRRSSQGLASVAVAFEEIAETFGHGQPSPEAVRDFLSFAFHSWARPSPRYVLLLGDSTFDPRRFQSSSWASPLPALWTRTSYLTTASDPALAAVNGADLLPDLAIGRLPAQTPDEARAMIQKVLAFEDSGQSLDAGAVLVADNPDEAGDFEWDVEDVRTSFLATRPTRVLKLRELGSSMRPAVKDAFDQGASLMSYVGHGGAALWASENVWNSWDVPSLLAQSRQPLLLTLNCLNGYFVANNHDALAEALLKAEGRGIIAGVSPSGLSLDGPAHVYHRALMAEVTSARHERLGDALLAAQRAYAQTGLMPELVAIYHLLGDPTLKAR